MLENQTRKNSGITKEELAAKANVAQTEVINRSGKRIWMILGIAVFVFLLISIMTTVLGAVLYNNIKATTKSSVTMEAELEEMIDG